MSNNVQDFFKSQPFSYIDAIVLVWLIVGLLRGRKLGMTQELLPVFRWLGIVLLGGFFYQPVSLLIMENTGGAFSLLWSRITAYCLIALGVALLFTVLKKMLGDRLTGSDLFGKYEYYLGMLSGLVRFACMLLVLLAVMHVRIVTQAELDGINAQMKKELNDIHPPRYIYGCIEQAIFFQSFTGKFVKDDLSDILIATVTPDLKPPPESLKKREQDDINNLTAPQKK